MREYVYQIRKDSPQESLLDLPLETQGKHYEVLAYAAAKGWTWIYKPSLLFEGYWRNEEGNCFYPT